MLGNPRHTHIHAHMHTHMHTHTYTQAYTMCMITQEPSFVMTLTGSQNTPVLVIETSLSKGEVVVNQSQALVNFHVYLKSWERTTVNNG